MSKGRGFLVTVKIISTFAGENIQRRFFIIKGGAHEKRGLLRQKEFLPLESQVSYFLPGELT